MTGQGEEVASVWREGGRNLNILSCKTHCTRLRKDAGLCRLRAPKRGTTDGGGTGRNCEACQSHIFLLKQVFLQLKSIGVGLKEFPQLLENIAWRKEVRRLVYGTRESNILSYIGLGIYIFKMTFIYMCKCACAPAHSCRGQWITRENRISPFATWELGIELRSSGLSANIFTCWASSVAQELGFYGCFQVQYLKRFLNWAFQLKSHMLHELTC